MANDAAAEIKIELTKNQLLERSKNISDVLKSGGDWNVKFGLKFRKIGKIFEEALDGLPDEMELKQSKYDKSRKDLQKEYAKIGKDLEFILDNGKLTFETEEKKGEFFAKLKVLNDGHNAFIEELDSILKEKVEVSAVPISKDLQPEKINGKLLDAISEWLEE